MSSSIGIIGLGRVGMPAAKAYLKHGYTVIGYDILTERLKDLTDAGGKTVPSPGDVSVATDTILILVLNDSQVHDAVTGENGVLKSIQKGATVVCMSTITKTALKTVWQQCENKGVHFIDCPFTGGPGRISTQSLTLIAAGKPEALSKVQSVLEVIGKITVAGTVPGMGQAIKHCNQLLVGVTHAATMEVILLAKKLNLDPELVAGVIGSGIAGSDYFRLLSDSAIHQTPSPGGLGQMSKDMSIVRDTLDESGFEAGVALAACKYFSEASDRNMQDLEGAELIKVVEQRIRRNR
jgi:3-hydroxyisobutyrate dehydrogenase-like beta-hydroxyacid dehydrogenase